MCTRNTRAYVRTCLIGQKFPRALYTIRLSTYLSKFLEPPLVIGEHLATAARNATYTSSVIQNQLVDVLCHQIRQKILDKVKRATWYTVIADEVTDISNKEQLSLVLRYVDPDTNQVQEDLISFFECDEGITGRCLAKKITDSLESFGLDLGKLRGQSYDGAGNMAGRVRGTAALISA